MDLIKSVSIEALVMKRELFKAKVEQVEEAMNQAEGIYDQANIGGHELYENVKFRQLTNPMFTFSRSQPFPTAEEFVKGFDAIAWKHLMSESGLKTFMSSQDIEAWEGLIREKKTPEFNVDNIKSTFSKLYDERGTMLEKGILKVFRDLSWSYKTNQPVKFGKKVILKGAAYSNNVTMDTARSVDDLVRFMHVSDGVPQPDHRQNFAFLYGYKSSLDAESFACPYMTIKGFKNGNMHIVFSRPDLIDKMNGIIGKHFPNALPRPD